MAGVLGIEPRYLGSEPSALTIVLYPYLLNTGASENTDSSLPEKGMGAIVSQKSAQEAHQLIDGRNARH